MIDVICICTYIRTYRNQIKGGWSSKGIIQDNNPDTKVSCASTHLTSFSVLISARAGSGKAGSRSEVSVYITVCKLCM